MRRPTVERRSRCASLRTGVTPGHPPLADHEHAIELDHGIASLVEPARMNSDETEAGPAPRLPCLQDFCVRVEGVSVEDGPCEAHALDAHLEAVLARDIDEDSCGNRHRQEPVHDPPPVERLPGEVPASVVFV